MTQLMRAVVGRPDRDDPDVRTTEEQAHRPSVQLTRLVAVGVLGGAAALALARRVIRR